MPSTQEMIESLFEIRLAQQTEPDNQELAKNLHEAEKNIIELLKKKTDNIDKFVMNLTEKKAIIKTQIMVQSEELHRLRKRWNSIDNTSKHFLHFTLPLIIREIGEDNKLETKLAKYTAFQTWKADSWELDKLDKKFIHIEKTYKIDKIAAKKAAIEAIKNKEKFTGCELKQEWNTRRS